MTSRDQPTVAPQPPPVDPLAVMRSRNYLVLLAMAALLGVPLSAGAWGFLQAVTRIEKAFYTDLPSGLGFHGVPLWWPLIPLTLAAVIVAATIKILPGTGGHRPAEGLKTTGAAPIELPGILVAALASISLGAVIGPEAPLIALGGGVAVYAVQLVMRLLKRDIDAPALKMVGAAGSFAAIAALLGSPLIGAFLLMEASGLAGTLLATVLLPGLLAAGIGSLVFIGLDSWTGLATTALTIPDLPPAAQPTVAEFGWALLIGVTAAFLGSAIRRAALYLQTHVMRRTLTLTLILGLAIAGLAIAYAQITSHPSSEVLFSGQTALGPLVGQSAQYTVGTLVLLVLFKSIAYAASLSAFRGGPIFPAMFLGAAGGIALSHLAGLSLIPGIAMGIGAMADAILSLPMTSVLLATLLLGKDGITVMPLVIVTVVVCHVVSVRIAPRATDVEKARR